MQSRLDVIEKDLDKVKTDVAVLLATIATKDDIHQIDARLQRVEATLPNFATLADLAEAKLELRNFVILIAGGVIVALAGLIITLHNSLANSLASQIAPLRAAIAIAPPSAPSPEKPPASR